MHVAFDINFYSIFIDFNRNS